MLHQADYGYTDFALQNLKDAKIVCGEDKENDCGEAGRMYLTNLCQGNPVLDCGRSHNHCKDCPGFGRCVFDPRSAHCFECGEHYVGTKCQCKGGMRPLEESREEVELFEGAGSDSEEEGGMEE